MFADVDGMTPYMVSQNSPDYFKLCTASHGKTVAAAQVLFGSFLFVVVLVDTTHLTPCSQRSTCSHCHTSHQVTKHCAGCKVSPSSVAEVFESWVFGWQMMWYFGATGTNSVASRLHGIVRRNARSRIGRCTRRRVIRRRYHHHNAKERQPRNKN